jgi:hypothetical protein
MIGTDVPFDVRMVFDIFDIWRRCLWCANAFMWWNEDGLSLHNFIPSLQFVLLDNFRFGSIAFHIFIQFIHSYTSIKRIWYSLSLLFSLSCPCIAFSSVCLSLCLTFVAVAAAAHMSKLSRFCLISSLLNHVCYYFMINQSITNTHSHTIKTFPTCVFARITIIRSIRFR